MLSAIQGHKTYIVATAIALLTTAKYLGYITEETFQMLVGLLGAGGAATLAAKINRVDKKMILFPFAILALSLGSVTLEAQAVPSSKLAWDQIAPDLVSSQSYTYTYYPDGAAIGTALASVTCAGTVSPFQCEVAYPSFTPGSHTLTLTAKNAAGESGKSTPFAFTFIVTPGIPTNIHIK